MRSLTVLVFLSFLFSSYAYVDGGSISLSNGEGGQFTMDWSICGQSPNNEIWITLRQQYNGYMGISFNNFGGAHAETDMIYAWLDSSGNPVVIDGYNEKRSCPQYGICNYPDIIVGGRDDVFCVSGGIVNNMTEISFRRKTATNDKYDFDILEGGTSIKWGWAEVPFQLTTDMNNLTYIHYASCTKYPACEAALDSGFRRNILYKNSTAKMYGDVSTVLWSGADGEYSPCSRCPFWPPEPELPPLPSPAPSVAPIPVPMNSTMPIPTPGTPTPPSITPAPETPSPSSPIIPAPGTPTPPPITPAPETPTPPTPNPQTPTSNPPTPLPVPSSSPSNPSPPTSGFNFNKVVGGVPVWGWMVIGCVLIVILVLVVAVFMIRRKTKREEWIFR